MVSPNSLSDDEKVTVHMEATTSGPFDHPEDRKSRSAVLVENWRGINLLPMADCMQKFPILNQLITTSIAKYIALTNTFSLYIQSITNRFTHEQ